MNNPPEKDNRKLVREIKAGNQRAFRQFIHQYERLVCHVVYRMVNNQTDRDDLCQTVFLKIYQHLQTFRFEAKISSWVAKIAYNSCLNHLQKKKVPLFDDKTPEEFSLNNVANDTPDPEFLTENKDVADLLQKAINNLDIRYRTILTMYHLDGMKYQEIGAIMDLPEGTVKSYLFRARQQLKNLLLTKYRKEELWNASI